MRIWTCQPLPNVYKVSQYITSLGPSNAGETEKKRTIKSLEDLSSIPNAQQGTSEQNVSKKTRITGKLAANII